MKKYYDVKKFAERLDRESEPLEIERMLRRIGAAELSGAEHESLIQLMKQKTGMAPSFLRERTEELRTMKKEQNLDGHKKFLEEHGLIRRHKSVEDHINDVQPDTFVWLPLPPFRDVEGIHNAKRFCGLFQKALCDEYAGDRDNVNTVKILPFLKCGPYEDLGKMAVYYVYRLLLKKPDSVEPDEFKDTIYDLWRNTKLPEMETCYPHYKFSNCGSKWFAYDPDLWQRPIEELAKLILDDTQQATPKNLEKWFLRDNAVL